MKKSILSLIAGAIVALASCSQSDDMPGQPQEGVQTATFTIRTPAATRTTGTGLSRYIVEAYEGSTATGTPVARVEEATGTLTLGLKKNTEYTFLFWADKGKAKTGSAASSGYWNTDDLKAVTITSGQESTAGEAAYCFAQTFNSANFETNKAVTLKNATAQVCFIEAAGLSAAGNELKVTYPKGGTLNVGTGSVTDVAGTITHTFTNIGQATANATLATDYILAPTGEDKVLNLTIQLNTESPKTIPNAPFRQCFSTNIKGEYSTFGQFTFTVTANDGWDGTNEVKELPKVGDYYYKDNTWSTEDKATVDNPIIGVVYKINDDGTTGKVVSLTEGTNLKWGPTSVTTGATSTKSGKENTEKVFTLIASQSYTLSDYPIFNACQEQRTNTGNDRWYIPGSSDYAHLFNAASTINNKITAISGGTGVVIPNYSNFYWTSEETASNTANVMMTNIGIGAINKGSSYRVRFVLDF
jgi:hypothetical protein